MKLFRILLFLALTSLGAGRNLSPVLELPGDFFIADVKGVIRYVGHLSLDFDAIYRDYASHGESSGSGVYSLARYDQGKPTDIETRKLTFSIGSGSSFFHLRPSVADAELDLEFSFDPKIAVVTAKVIEGNIAGSKHVGFADIRLRR